MIMNVFLDKYTTPYETVPFDKIRFEDYEEAMLEGMRREDADLQRILDNPEPPTFENTIDTLDDRTLERVTTTFFNLLSAHTNDEMDALAQKMQPLLTEHSQNIMLNERYFQRVKAVKDQCLRLDVQDKRLLDNLYESFERNGATLPEDKKVRFRQLMQELGMLTLQFQQNELKDTNEFSLHVTSAEELRGLPDTALEAAAQAAREAGKEGWLFTLHAPSFTPFMMYSENRELRRRMYMARQTLCTHGNAYDNRDIVVRIVNLRRQLAQLLGYRHWAEYVLKRRMAENVENVNDLLEKLIEAYLPVARKEVAEVEALARSREGEDFCLMPWDFAHYSHLLKMERYHIDAEMLRPYFELSRVQEGVFGLATRLYGITFHLREDIPVYHPDVQAWEVRDEDGSFLAVLYTDFFPRPSKQSGAWMTNYKEQWIDKETQQDSRPVVSVVMNFTKPTDTKPALLTLGEVETFLHEFGHALHGMFSKVRHASLSGTNVYWDFVELPSQFMENYALEPEFLRTFAYHYETGEPLPEEWIERIRAARNFMAGYDCMRQVSFGLLDMELYTRTTPIEAAAEGEHPLLQIEHEVWRRIGLSRPPRETCMLAQFGHIMSGGYAAGYYSYKWAEVLEADAFECFRREGIFNAATAQRFRDTILSQGGTRHPSELYRDFRGQEATIDAMLRRDGLA